MLWLVGFGSYGSVYLLLSVLPLHLRKWGLSDVEVGVLVGLMSGAAFVCRPFAGWLADSLGRKPLVAVGAAGLLISSAGLPFAGGVVPFAVLRLINGAGWGSLTSNANTMAGEFAPQGRRGEALGLYTMAGSVALAGGPAIGLFVAAAMGDAAAFWASAAFAGLAALAAVFLPVPRVSRRPLPRLGPAALVSGRAIAPALVLFMHAFMYGGLITFLPLLANQRHLGNAGLFFTVYAAGLVVLRGIAGRLSDRFGPMRVLVPGLAGGVLSMWVLAIAGSLPEMLAAAALFALAMGLVQPPALAWGLELGADRRATAMATMVMAQDLGIIIGGTLLGVVGTLGGYGWLFAAGGVPGVLALLGLGVARRRGLLKARN